VNKHAIRVSSGKYTFLISDFQTVDILRHGEEWHRQQDAFNALHSIICELDAARVVLAAARSLANRGEAPAALVQALELHKRLVSDSEHPSEWAAPSEPRAS
jgi:hypothetical protein